MFEGGGHHLIGGLVRGLGVGGYVDSTRRFIDPRLDRRAAEFHRRHVESKTKLHWYHLKMLPNLEEGARTQTRIAGSYVCFVR